MAFEDSISSPASLAQDSLRSLKTPEKPTEPENGSEPKKITIWKRIKNYIDEANIDKTQTQRFDFTILGGPHYAPETQLGLGVVAAGLFRINQEDLSIPPSNLSLFGDLSITGAYALGIQGNTYYKGGEFRLDHRFSFSFRPSDFWGVGYYNGRDSAKCDMDRQLIQVQLDFLYRTLPNWYLGAIFGFQFCHGKELEKPHYIPEGQETKYINTGIGASLSYDSRDIITDPHSGFYFKLAQVFYPEFLGNKTGFTSTEVIVDNFRPLWQGAILATDLHGLFHNGDVPWTMLSQIGSPFRMRGYYEGRYRDKNMVEVQAELRQKLWRRFGGVVWAGAGTIFPKFDEFKVSHTLLNCGLGVRWELKSRVNVRLDWGFGKGQTGAVLSLYEAF